jgi:hypothetical protein
MPITLPLRTPPAGAGLVVAGGVVARVVETGLVVGVVADGAVVDGAVVDAAVVVVAAGLAARGLCAVWTDPLQAVTARAPAAIRPASHGAGRLIG